MKQMFKDFEDSMVKRAEYVNQTQLNMLEQTAKFPKWLAANDYCIHIPKQVLESLNKTLDTAGKLIEAGFLRLPRTTGRQETNKQ